MTRRGRIALKVGVWLVGLAPLAWLSYRAWHGDLTANPISFVTNTLGDWTLRLLLASLAMTPLRLFFSLAWPATLRRLLGLFAFFYATLHFGVWLVLDHYFDWSEMGADILKRRYITVGMTALTLLIPLAVTSTSGMIRRLGGANWRRLHRLVYAAAVAAIFHFIWLAKVGRTDQYVYGAILALLLGVRVADAARRFFARRRAAAPRRLSRPSATSASL